MGCEDAGDDSESEAGTAGLAVAGGICAVEALEDATAVGFVDAGSVGA